MSANDLAFGRRVRWRGLCGEIVDIRWGAQPKVQIRVIGGYRHWVEPSELEVIE